MRTLGSKVVRGRWGRSATGRSRTKSLTAADVAVLVRCTTAWPGRHGSGQKPRIKSHRAPGDAATAWKWADATRAFKIGLGAERAGLHTRCQESPAIMRAKPVVGKR